MPSNKWESSWCITKKKTNQFKEPSWMKSFLRKLKGSDNFPIKNKLIWKSAPINARYLKVLKLPAFKKLTLSLWKIQTLPSSDLDKSLWLQWEWELSWFQVHHLIPALQRVWWLNLTEKLTKSIKLVSKFNNSVPSLQLTKSN